MGWVTPLGAGLDEVWARLENGERAEPQEISSPHSPKKHRVLAVPPKSLKALEAVFAAEGCETSVIGEFTRDGRLIVTHHDNVVVDLEMKFLHKGLPRVERTAVWNGPTTTKPTGGTEKKLAAALKDAIGHINVCSREWVIRQYDHEVQGGTVIKPLQGVRHDGPQHGGFIHVGRYFQGRNPAAGFNAGQPAGIGQGVHVAPRRAVGAGSLHGGVSTGVVEGAQVQVPKRHVAHAAE